MRVISLIFFCPLLAISPGPSTARILAPNANNGHNTDYDCDVGCSLERKSMGPMVCGTDSITYFNECLAVCQGIEIQKNGACPGGIGNGRPETYDEEGFIDNASMNRFKNENFKVVGKRKGLGNQVHENVVDAGNLPSEDTPIPDKVRLMRLNGDDFLEYQKDINPEELPEVPIEIPADEPNAEPTLEDGTPEEEDPLDGGGRNLWVYSPDDRYELRGSSAYTWPNRLNGKLSQGCSGTVIARDAVLTAGHCVHEGNGGNWIWGNFAPAQWRTTTGSVVKPYGTWNTRYMTTYVGWTQEYKNWKYDIAVIRLHPNSRGDVGSYLGYAGLQQTSTSHINNNNDPRSIVTTGYPSDKSGLEMWKSPCAYNTDWYGTWTPYVGKHYCDIYKGNSGGSFIDYAGYIYAVQSFHGSYNGAVLLYGMHYNNVLRWAGRA